MSEPLLQNDSALVTGAAQGIGQAIARAIGDEGAKVLGVDREFDLSRPGIAQELAAHAIQTLGAVSIFVHAASPPRREEQHALAVSEAQWREMLEVNLFSNNGPRRDISAIARRCAGAAHHNGGILWNVARAAPD